MALPLNVFKTVALDVPGSATEIYTAPTGYTAIVLLAQVCNTDVIAQTVSFYHKRGATSTALVYDYEIPPNETLVLTSGRLVLETGDKLELSGSDTELKFVASVLETLK